MAEETNPQSGVTPEGETTKVETVQPEVKVETAETKAPVLSEESIKKIIAEQFEGQMYRIKDSAKTTVRKELDEALRRAKLAEDKAKIYEGSFNDLDEDSREKLELRKLRAETQLYKTREQQEQAQRQQEEQRLKLEQSLKDEAESLGIDPTDKRLDYAHDAKDYFEGRKRYTESLSKIVKENRANLESTLKKEAEDRFRQFETDFRKKYNLDSQDTTTSAGVVDKSDADFMSAFGAGDLPANKENLTRYEKIQKTYYK